MPTEKKIFFVVHHSAFFLNNFVRCMPMTLGESGKSYKDSDIYVFLTRFSKNDSRIRNCNSYHLAIFQNVIDDIMCDGTDIIFFTEPTAFYDDKWLRELKITGDHEVHFYNDFSYACTIDCAKLICKKDYLNPDAKNLRHGLEMHGGYEVVLNPVYSHVQFPERWPLYPIILYKDVTCSYEESYELSNIELYKVKIL